MIILAVLLTLSPWKGAPLPTATPGAKQVRLSVHGTAGARVALQASGLPQGWIASFCTPELCSPDRYVLQLDGRGSGSVEFQAIRIDDSAPKRAHVVVRADDGAATATSVAVP